jgi:hypothetical protein
MLSVQGENDGIVTALELGALWGSIAKHRQDKPKGSLKAKPFPTALSDVFPRLLLQNLQASARP